MMNTEESFLKAYRCALHEEVTDDEYWKQASVTDLKKVFRLADSHCVLPMVIDSVYQSVSPAVKDSGFYSYHVKKASDLTCRQARMSAEFLKLYRYLNRHGLKPVVMKGMICRMLYPNPEQRASSDEDLLIPAEQFHEYHRLLTEYGLKLAFPQLDIEKEHEVSYFNHQLYIELHKSPFPPESKAYGDLNRYFENTEENKITEMIYGVPVCTMEYTDHLFYQICHAYKHFLNCGIGIRLVSDIVLYSITYNDRIDWDKVTEQCKEIHAYEFASALYRIGEIHLFPSRIPEDLKTVWNTDQINEESILKDILTGGVYGTSTADRMHSANITLHAAEQEKTGVRSSALIYALFPSFEIMKNRYPYLQKYPFLLPFAWIQRIFSYVYSSIFHKTTGNNATEAMRIGNERLALMRKYHILEEKKKEGNVFKRLYKWSHKSFLAPVLSLVFILISWMEYHILNLIWRIKGYRYPDKEEQELVKENVTFVFKSFERQGLAKGLIRNISKIYPGVSIIVADDSRIPLEVNLPNVRVIHLPFNSGLSAGLQAALEEVRTPYVMRMDDDELLTVRSEVHRELRYLMKHEELDLIGFGHTTAIRLHSPEFNFEEYYKYPMKDALRPLKIPHLTQIDRNHTVLGKVANIYIARTEKMKEVGFDANIKVIDHHEFFWRAAGIITSAVALDTVVFHRHNPYVRGYNTYRSDYASDLKYIEEKHRRMKQEKRRRDEKTD